MYGFGALFWIAGILLIAFGLAYDPTVSTTVSSYSNPYLPSLPDRVANLGLLQNRLILFETGIGSSIIGTLFIGFGAVVAAAKSQATLPDRRMTEPSVETETARSESTVIDRAVRTPGVPKEDSAAEKTIYICGIALVIIAAVALAINLIANGS